MAGSEQEPKHVVAKPIRQIKKKKTSKRETWAEVCYCYPQYTLEEASKLPLRDINLLLKVAKKQQAEQYFNLTQIAAAPHSEKGKGVQELTDRYQEIMEK